MVRAWANGDDGRVDLKASEFVTIKGKLTFYCAKRVYHNTEVGLLCYASGFEYSISSIAKPKNEAEVEAIIATIE